MVIGLFVGTAVLTLYGGLWLMAATTPDQSALSKEVGATVLSFHKERRASSTYRNGYRIGYSYRVGGTTYVADEFVPLPYWPLRTPPRVCVDPASPAEHALPLHANQSCGGRYVGHQQTAAPADGG